MYSVLVYNDKGNLEKTIKIEKYKELIKWIKDFNCSVEFLIGYSFLVRKV